MKNTAGVTEPVVVKWEPGVDRSTATYFGVPSNPLLPRRIEVNGSQARVGPDELDNAVLLHEYGHHVAFGNGLTAANPDPPESTRGPEQRQINEQVAWNEGWAYYFGAFRQQWPTSEERPIFRNTTSVGAFQSLNLESGKIWVSTGLAESLQVATVNDSGPRWDLAVAGTLWDVYDSSNDNPGHNLFWDNWSDGPMKMWQTLLSPSFRGRFDSVCWFQAFFDSLHNDPELYAERFVRSREVFREHGMRCSYQQTPITGIDAPSTTVGPTLTIRAAPNPFNPTTEIVVTARGGNAMEQMAVRVLDIQGRVVRELKHGDMPIGSHRLVWDGKDDRGRTVASGVYICAASFGTAVTWQKVVLVR